MNNDHQEKQKLSTMTISELEKAAIKHSADRVGKQIGDAVSSLLTEIMLSILAAKPQTTLPRSDSILTASKASKVLPEPDDILTASEVARFLKISRGKAYRMMQLGEIRAIHFDRTTRVRRQDLDEFIREHMK